MNRLKRQGRDGETEVRAGPLPGIIIHGREDFRPDHPRIQAFIWGGEVPPTPTLPFGRRKNVA